MKTKKIQITLKLKVKKIQKRVKDEFPVGYWVLIPKNEKSYDEFILMENGELSINDNLIPIMKVNLKDLGLDIKDLQ